MEINMWYDVSGSETGGGRVGGNGEREQMAQEQKIGEKHVSSPHIQGPLLGWGRGRWVGSARRTNQKHALGTKGTGSGFCARAADVHACKATITIHTHTHPHTPSPPPGPRGVVKSATLTKTTPDHLYPSVTHNPSEREIMKIYS